MVIRLPFGWAQPQSTSVKSIDLYGLRTVSEQKVRQALQVSAGDLLPASLDEIRVRLEALPGVSQSAPDGRLL